MLREKRVILEPQDPHHTSFPHLLSYLLGRTSIFLGNSRIGAHWRSSSFMKKMENLDLLQPLIGLFWIILMPPNYWSHPSGKTLIVCDPDYQFSTCLDKRGWVMLVQGIVQGKVFTINWWWSKDVSVMLSNPTIFFSHSLSHSLQLLSLLSEQFQPPSLFLTAGLWLTLSLPSTKDENLASSSTILPLSLLTTEDCFFWFLN